MTWTDLKTRLDDAGYVASDELAMAIHIALQLERPILLEGDAGVGKTQIAKTLAEIEDTELIRLQCYEGLDAASSIYEWNYCLLYTSPSPRDNRVSRMPSSA